MQRGGEGCLADVDLKNFREIFVGRSNVQGVGVGLPDRHQRGGRLKRDSNGVIDAGRMTV